MRARSLRERTVFGRRRSHGLVPQYPITDEAALRSVLRTVVEKCGGRRKAAKALGIDPRTLRYHLGGSKRIRHDTFVKVREALKAIEAEGRLEQLFTQGVLTVDGSFVEVRYQQWLEAELERLKPKVHSAFEELLRRPQCEEQFRTFLQQVNRRPELPDPEDKRTWVALYRAIEPLADAAATWGVERAMQEMDEVELQQFLRAALKRERIMLHRDRDAERLGRCKLPIEWWIENLRGRPVTAEELAAADAEEARSRASRE
jgi:hypothetical protein